MTTEQVLTTLTDIFREVLDNEEIELTLDSSALDIEEWDSLSHIHLVVAVEKHFKIKFTSLEIQNWNKIGDLILSIQNKIS